MKIKEENKKICAKSENILFFDVLLSKLNQFRPVFFPWLDAHFYFTIDKFVLTTQFAINIIQFTWQSAFFRTQGNKIFANVSHVLLSSWILYDACALIIASKLHTWRKRFVFSLLFDNVWCFEEILKKKFYWNKSIRLIRLIKWDNSRE